MENRTAIRTTETRISLDELKRHALLTCSQCVARTTGEMDYGVYRWATWDEQKRAWICDTCGGDK